MSIIQGLKERLVRPVRRKKVEDWGPDQVMDSELDLKISRKLLEDFK